MPQFFMVKTSALIPFSQDRGSYS
jgi:hypothetical protein